MTITEFILARIARDEQLAHEHLAEIERDFGTAATNELDSMLSHEGLTDMAYPVLVIDGTRVLAECEAKRRIVEKAAVPVVRVPPEDQWPFGRVRFDDGRVLDSAENDITDRYNEWADEHEEPRDPDTLRTLASVYADHPDFQDEWRTA